jgi:hypothetical protein
VIGPSIIWWRAGIAWNGGQFKIESPYWSAKFSGPRWSEEQPKIVRCRRKRQPADQIRSRCVENCIGVQTQVCSLVKNLVQNVEMTVQPSFSYLRSRHTSDDKGDQQKVGEIPSEGEKDLPNTAHRSDSVSSIGSEEKQTYGVSKVEAVTTVWTKAALITLYGLYSIF